jgi:exopolysaccharide biosynthesis predicted pyruvyltransferase EpsI
LCELLGVPHALLDNSYGKLGRFHAAWTTRSRCATLCRDRTALLAWLEGGQAG